MREDFCRGWWFCKKGQPSTKVNLPHDAMLTEERSAVCNNGDRTGYYPGGEYLYEKEFVLTEQEAKGYVAIRFGRVYRHATVSPLQ